MVSILTAAAPTNNALEFYNNNNQTPTSATTLRSLR
jgi:hypothetical protein